MIVRRRDALAVALVAVGATLAVSCTSGAHESPQGSTSAPSPPASSAASDINGAHVRVLGLWSGPELDSFTTVKSAWEKATGATVDWQATQNPSADLDAAAQSGNTPDIAVLPNLGLMQQLADDGKLVPLDAVLDMAQVEKDYAESWRDLGSIQGKLYGIFYKVTSKATVWYNPKAFAAAHYDVPKSWDDMTALADKMVADGHTPFSIVGASGPANGWALTDWISEIVLNSCGPDLYDKWVAGQIPWTDACVKQSFETFVNLVQAKDYVLGGSQRIVSTPDSTAANPLYTDPPDAYMCYLASFAQAFIASSYPNLKPGDDYSVFPFPSIKPQYAGAAAIGADILVMVHDTPAARSFMSYLAGAQAQEAWIKLGGFTSVDRNVPLDTYPDPVARTIADELTSANVVRFSAGDMMPATVQRAWWSAMLQLVQDPTKLDSILNELTAVAQTKG